jgi:hypothetical protein
VSIKSKRINLRTNLQAVAVEIHFPFKFVICSIYLPPNFSITQSDLEDLLNQLGDRYVLTGDFNAHSSYWGSLNANSRGKVVEKIIDTKDIDVLTRPTHLNLMTKNFYHSDASICTSNIYNDLERTVLDDVYGSDHFPMKIEFINTCISETKLPRFVVEKANWQLFAENLVFASISRDLIDTMVEDFTNFS